MSTPDTSSNDLPFIYVTTTGWKSGKVHQIEIWFVAYASKYYIVAEYGERAHWVQNIRHQPAVTIRLAYSVFPGSARIINAGQEPELVARVSALMEAKYNWSDGLIVELAPTVS